MPQLNERLADVAVDDPTIEAALGALIRAEEMAALVHAEAELLKAETIQIRTSSRALKEAASLSSEAALAAVVLTKWWGL